MGPIRVTTTHLEYYSDVQRRAQAHRLRALQDEACHRAVAPGFPTAERGPFDATPQTTRAILTGDFNFPPEHPAFDEIQQPLPGGAPRYRDAWRHLNPTRPHAPTFCLFDRRYSKTPYCCDFIFASEDLLPRVRAVAVDGETRASDHQPVLLELDDR
jgi:endonuclease/exonuclease/phosphatase family metal-dependent hydrolase